jgi:hypothetical protein
MQFDDIKPEPNYSAHERAKDASATDLPTFSIARPRRGGDFVYSPRVKTRDLPYHRNERRFNRKFYHANPAPSRFFDTIELFALPKGSTSSRIRNRNFPYRGAFGQARALTAGPAGVWRDSGDHVIHIMFTGSAAVCSSGIETSKSIALNTPCSSLPRTA